MNVDLLPPTFAQVEQAPPAQCCGDCSSWREHPLFSGHCCMTGRARGPMQTPDIIGPSVFFQDRHNYCGPIWTCFTEKLYPHHSGAFDRYGSVTRTETAKSGQKSGLQHG